MHNKWQHSSRDSLRGASECNVFFKTNKFTDNGFKIKIPLEFARLVNKVDPNDPLLIQVISHKTRTQSGFKSSPLEDEKFSPVDGLIHKYNNRVLLIVSRSCAIHCQYCFRQNFDYAGHDAISNWGSISDYIDDNKQINEVILSGGDPLSLGDNKIKWLINEIENIAHIKTIRIHTRTAVVVPSRITIELAETLNNTSLNVVLVFHTNHPQELTNEFKESLKKLSNLTLLNQSVLLKGVNDAGDTLVNLSKKLFSFGILPYYLHMLDRVGGSEAFLVTDNSAIELHEHLKRELSGYLVPRLVRDENFEFKSWLGLQD